MAKRKVKAWLCRNSRRDDGDYLLYIGRTPNKDRDYGFWCGADRVFCSAVTHTLGLRLNYGEGPVELKVSLVRKRGDK
jgi:hypothetical protein